MRDEAGRIPPDIGGSYAYLFARAERRFGEGFVGAVLDLLAASRYGLREDDLAQMVGGPTRVDWDPLRFAVLRRYLRAHLVQRGAEGLWDFTHAQPRLALRAGRLSDAARSRELHRRLADHLEKLPSEDWLHQSELMYHYWQADEKARAAAYYGGFRAGVGAAAGATRVLAEAIAEGAGVGTNPALAWALALAADPRVPDAQRRGLCNRYIFDLHDALVDRAGLEARRGLLVETGKALEELRRRAPDSAEYARDLSVSYNKLGDLYRQLGEPPRALEHYQKALAIAEELRRRAPDSADYARDLSVSYNKLGDLYLQLGEPPRALDYHQKALALREDLRRRAPDSADYARDLVVSCYKLATFQEQQGGAGDGRRYWDECRKALRYMKDRRMFMDPPLEQLLKRLGG